MDEQPKPASRRTATKSPTKTAAGPLKTANKPAKAANPKGPARKRTPVTAAPELSTLDFVSSMVPPRIADLIARLGPDARDWVARTRERYPAATPAAVSRLAATQRREPAWLVLAIAAAHGANPTNPARATDLRELNIYSGRPGLEARARARYSQETRLTNAV